MNTCRRWTCRKK